MQKWGVNTDYTVIDNRYQTALAFVSLDENGDREFAVSADDTEKEKPLSEIEKIISEVDMNSISPMQAFLLLGDLAEKVKL